MNNKELFGVATRIVGLWQLTQGFQHLVYAIDLRLELFANRSGIYDESSNFPGYVFYAVAHTAFGLALLLWAEAFVAIAYRPKVETTDQQLDD